MPYGLLKKSRDLKKVDKFCRVYISPDIAWSQRVERRELSAGESNETARVTGREPALLHSRWTDTVRGAGEREESGGGQCMRIRLTVAGSRTMRFKIADFFFLH